MRSTLPSRPQPMPYEGIFEYGDDPIVSSDIVDNPLLHLRFAQHEGLSGKTVKVIMWYDNEWGYSNRTVDLAERLMQLEASARGSIENVKRDRERFILYTCFDVSCFC